MMRAFDGGHDIMATLTHSTPLAAPVRTAGLFASIAGLLGSFAAAQRAAQLYSDLDMLSDEALAARGLTRSDIAAIAARELNGR
jgi:uncharacterized protein YjiS (DUF1127 family)